MFRTLILVTGFVTAGMALEATALPFAGAEWSGALSVSPEGRIALGGTAVDLRDLDRLRLAGEPTAAAGSLGLWLIDGSWLPITRVGSTSSDRIQVQGPLGALDLPLSAVRGWGAALPAAHDGDVVTLESGSYPARVNGIVNGELAFSGELGDVTVPVAKIVALRLAGTDRPARGITLAANLDPAKPHLHLLPGPVPRLAAAPEVTLAAWPSGRELRVEGGRRVYLGSLKTAAVKEEGAFGVVWPHVADLNLDREPLLLGGERFAHGLSMHSQCALSWQLDGAFLRLRALAGIADEVRPEGDCPVTLFGDGKVLWKADRLSGRDKPQPIDVDLSGVKVLEIRVEFGNRYDIGDRVALADAYMVKK